MQQQITIVLLLGSYDPQTKSFLEIIREEIAKKYSGENVYTLLLDNTEIYLAENIQILTELFDKAMATLFIFKNGMLSDVQDVNLKHSLDETVFDFLKEKYGIQRISKEPIFNKFNTMIRLAKVIFLVRDKEETRGGEYVELMHVLFERHSQKVWFLKRNGIRLSAMLMEYLDKFKVNLRSYSDKQDLLSEIARLLKYEISS